MRMMPPAGAAMANSRCPVNARKARSPENSAAPRTQPASARIKSARKQEAVLEERSASDHSSGVNEQHVAGAGAGRRRSVGMHAGSGKHDAARSHQAGQQ